MFSFYRSSSTELPDSCPQISRTLLAAGRLRGRPPRTRALPHGPPAAPPRLPTCLLTARTIPDRRGPTHWGSRPASRSPGPGGAPPARQPRDVTRGPRLSLLQLMHHGGPPHAVATGLPRGSPWRRGRTGLVTCPAAKTRYAPGQRGTRESLSDYVGISQLPAGSRQGVLMIPTKLGMTRAVEAVRGRGGGPFWEHAPKGKLCPPLAAFPASKDGGRGVAGARVTPESPTPVGRAARRRSGSSL